MKYKDCTICNRNWNVSEKNKSKKYICPICEETAKKEGNVTKVLLKNKNKAQI